jgi:hypothetical protein
MVSKVELLEKTKGGGKEEKNSREGVGGKG